MDEDLIVPANGGVEVSRGHVILSTPATRVESREGGSGSAGVRRDPKSHPQGPSSAFAGMQSLAHRGYHWYILITVGCSERPMDA